MRVVGWSLIVVAAALGVFSFAVNPAHPWQAGLLLVVLVAGAGAGLVEEAGER